MAFQDEKKTLLEILAFIRSVLDELILGHITEDKPLFQSAWTMEVRPHLDGLAAQYQAVASEATPEWQELKQHGLTGEQLKLKRARLKRASSSGILKRILDLINTILSSIPGAELVKEFKEFTEDGLDDENASIGSTLA